MTYSWLLLVAIAFKAIWIAYSSAEKMEAYLGRDARVDVDPKQQAAPTPLAFFDPSVYIWLWF